jgi:hypothetical protein
MGGPGGVGVVAPLITDGVVGDTMVVGEEPTGSEPAMAWPTPVATAWPTLVGALLEVEELVVAGVVEAEEAVAAGAAELPLEPE